MNMKHNDELKEMDSKNRTCYWFDDAIEIDDFIR